MALETAAGAVSVPENLLALTLADSQKFRDFVGATTQAEALARIYFGSLPPPSSGADEFTAAELSALRPFAILWTDEEAGLTLDVVDVGASWHLEPTSGVLIVRFEADAGDGMPEEEDRVFKNDVGLIAQSRDADNPGLAEMSGRGGYLAIRRMRVYGPWRAHEDEVEALGDHFAARIDVEWGIRA